MRNLYTALAAVLSSVATAEIASADQNFYNWSGIYIGLNAGYLFSNHSVQSIGSPSFANGVFFPGAFAQANALAAIGTYTLRNSSGGLIGGQLGYNWQIAGWVLGFETDIQGISIHTKNQMSSVPVLGFSEQTTGIQSASGRTDWFGTVRGRLGSLVTPSLMLFGTGGLAYGHVNLSASVAGQETSAPLPFSGGGGVSATHSGWTLGAGLEWMFTPGWSAKAEYLYYDLGSLSTSYTLAQYCSPGGCGGFPQGGLWAAAAVQISTRLNGNIVRAGVNYHF